MLLLRLALHSRVLGVAPHPGMPFADLDQAELGADGFEHGCSLSVVVVRVCVGRGELVCGARGATAARVCGVAGAVAGRTRSRRQATAQVPARGSAMDCMSVSCSNCGVIFIVSLLSLR
jgi:hypothetical protein